MLVCLPLLFSLESNNCMVLLVKRFLTCVSCFVWFLILIRIKMNYIWITNGTWKWNQYEIAPATTTKSAVHFIMIVFFWKFLQVIIKMNGIRTQHPEYEYGTKRANLQWQILYFIFNSTAFVTLCSVFASFSSILSNKNAHVSVCKTKCYINDCDKQWKMVGSYAVHPFAIIHTPSSLHSTIIKYTNKKKPSHRVCSAVVNALHTKQVL